MAKQVHLRLDDTTYDMLQKLALETGKPLQDCITEAVVTAANSRSGQPEQEQEKFTFIDLFAGIGGMRLAFEAWGGKCVFSSEWDKYCQKTYLSNFGDIPKGNIKTVYAKDIPNHDILVAGFPCQPFSIAGISKKNSLDRGTGFVDMTQGTLFFDIARIINEKRPRAFLLENVKNLKSHDKGKTWRIIQYVLEDLDYEVFEQVIDGQGHVPQHRERIFVVGFDRKRYGREVGFDFQLQTPERSPVLQDILEEEVDERYTLSDHLWTYLQNYAEKHRAKGNGFGFGLADLAGSTRTLSARYYKDGSEILIPQEGRNPRKLTPRECARLQGYDDSYKIVVSDTQAYKQFGNSVVVPLVREVAGRIVEKLDTLQELEIENEEVSKQYLYSYREGKLQEQVESDTATARQTIDAVEKGEMCYYRFLTPIDTNAANTHQGGIYINKAGSDFLFDEPLDKKINMERDARITWHDGTVTDNRFKYYGAKKNELRITRFGKGFRFLFPEHTGDLLVLVKNHNGEYSGFILDREAEIAQFLEYFGLSPTKTSGVLRRSEEEANELLEAEIERYLNSLEVEFPDTEEMSAAAWRIYEKMPGTARQIVQDPDKLIMNLIDLEYRMLRQLENRHYMDKFSKIETVEEGMKLSNTVLNRRKRRAGRSLQNHLSWLFQANELPFAHPCRTEGNKQVDFVFPGREAYANPKYPENRLLSLACKMTCKERWRMILNDADRVSTKYLFTMQQAMSAHQVEAMEAEGVVLVVPKELQDRGYPKGKKNLLTMKEFMELVKSREFEPEETECANPAV